MNVYELAINRIQKIFDEFDNVYVSFSGGKDSGVLLNLTSKVAAEKGRRFGIFHIDYEAQYELTTEYVDRTLQQFKNVADVYRCCLPLKCPTATSMHESYWRPWDPDKNDIWVRQLPELHHDHTQFEFYNTNMSDYEFQEKFSSWIHAKHNSIKTCCLVGIRTQESLNRWRSIHSDRNYKNYKGWNYSKEIAPGIYNAYPIYDWVTEDIWTANAKFEWDYNKLYDLFYLAGVPIDKMRVASPFHSAAQDSLKLYRVIEPHTWGKLVSRVNGVNFTGIYGGTTAMGWKSISLPPGHTWESYMHFLLSTLPDDTRENYLNKLSVSINFWRAKGGVLSDETIEKLKAAGVKLEVQKTTNYKTNKKPVRMEYLDDIDIEEFREIPTFKRMCICIMKNDHLCKYMGFSLTKNELVRRKAIIDKYKSLL